MLPVSWVRTLRRFTALAGIALPFAIPAFAQGTGIIEGKVTDSESGRAVEAVQVFVVDGRQGALTNAQGQYRIVGVPVTGGSRPVVVRVRALGFQPLSRSVTLTAGQTARADFAVVKSAIQLNQVVVTGSGQATETKRLGNTVAVIEPPQNAPINDVSSLLTAREPGLVGVTGGGMSGQGAMIRIRGNASLSQSNEPIIFIDGVRANNGSSFGGIGTGGGGATTRLDDIDPNIIERVEVLKGAAAATLYGTEASNGVINIITKQGANVPTRWNFSVQQDATQFPDRVAPVAGFARRQGQADTLSQIWQRTIVPFQVFEENVFRDFLTETGYNTVAGGNVTGGTNAFTFFASGRYANENGPFGGADYGPATDRVRRAQTAANVTLKPFRGFKLAVRNQYVNTLNSTPESNNNIYGVNSLAFMARPELANCALSSIESRGKCTGAGNPFGNQAFMTVREAMGQINQSSASRYIGGLDMSYQQTEHLNYTSTIGYDIASTREFGYAGFGYNVDRFTAQTPNGRRDVYTSTSRVSTVDAKVAYNRGFGDFSTANVGGLQVFNNRFASSSGGAQDFPGPGIEVVNAGATAIAASEQFLTTINGGYFGQTQLGWRDWMFVTGGGRYDFASAFGANAGGVFYPKVSVSIVPSDRKSWNSSTFSNVRIFAALGRSGRQPGAFDRFTTFSAITAEAGAGLQPNNLGSEDLRPEISREREGGIELGLFQNKAALTFTAWDRKVSDALVSRQFPTSGGFRNTQLVNIGQLDAQGLELSVRLNPIRRANTELSLFANAAYLKQDLTSLGGAPPIKIGYFRYRGFLKEGAPLGSIYEPLLATACPGGGTTPATNSLNQPITCFGPGQYPINFNGRGTAATEAELLAYFAQPRDLLNAGVQSTLQPLLADYQGTGILFEQRVGDIFPDWTGSFGANFRFAKHFRLQTNFEFRTGFLVQNLTDGFRASQHPSIGSNRREFSEIHSTLLNPASTPEQRVAAAQLYVTQYRRLLEPGLNQAQDGSFMRLRELGLTVDVPESFARKLGARALSATIAGRNLLLWTKYKGTDPETNAIDRSASILDQNFLNSTDAFGVPIPRRVSFTINYGY
jgi:TonB-dependent starch-binding outer membrane protein SusC